MPSVSFPSSPKAHASADLVAAKRALRDEPHVAPLTALADRIADEVGAEVPSFDPASGGIGSRVLLLLASPGKKALRRGTGSGFISVDNDDETARATFETMAEAGLDRRITVNWNIVPWFLGERRDPTDDELESARPYVRDLLGLLPELRVVVLLGDAATDGWRLQDRRPDLTVLAKVPHPSPSSLRTRPGRRPLLVEKLRAATGAAG